MLSIQRRERSRPAGRLFFCAVKQELLPKMTEILWLHDPAWFDSVRGLCYSCKEYPHVQGGFSFTPDPGIVPALQLV